MDARARIEEYAQVARKGTEAFWTRIKKWFLVTAILGLLVGLAVTALDYVIFEVLWARLSPELGPVGVVLAPTAGLFLSGLALQYWTSNPEINGTEEVIEAYHERGGRFRMAAFPGKVLAAIATIGSGGSAGPEGPSIYVGGALGSWVLQRVRDIFGFTDEDVRTLVVAGSAAGISAVFKAPLTGIVFALEVPYMDDIARESLIPSLIASVTSYLVLVQFLGVTPLFLVDERYTLAPTDLLYAILVGVLVGVVARAFIRSFRKAEEIAARSRLPLFARTAIGGFVTGLMGLAALLLFDRPLVLGTGYEAITGLVTGRFSAIDALGLLLLKTGATIATLGSGAAGGAFIPMIMLGAASGVMLQGVLAGAQGALFPIVGMAAFLAAGYNTPIAATVFIAESTGGTGYIIPGLVAAAVAYTVAGRLSISGRQRWRRETRLDRLLTTSVRNIMTKDVVGVPADAPLSRFLTDFVVKMRHKSFPVLDDGRLVGFIALQDIREVPREDWDSVKVRELMVLDVATVTAEESVGRLIEVMADGDFDRVPVVEPDDRSAIVGIASSTDVLTIDAICADWRGRRRRPPLA